MVVFSLGREGESEVPLLKVLEDLPRYFESARESAEQADFPASFAFPRSYSYELTYGQVT